MTQLDQLIAAILGLGFGGMLVISIFLISTMLPPMPLQSFIDWAFKKESIDGSELFPEPHFYRWTIFRGPRGTAVYIHHFVSSDHWPNPHDHPKTFISIGLKGQYREFTFNGGEADVERFKAPWIRRFPPEHRHKIMLIDHEPCWTLVLVGPTRRPWGFWTNGMRGWIFWREYVHDPEIRSRVSQRIY